MTSHDLSHSVVTYQIAFDQHDFHATPEIKHVRDSHCQVLVSQLEILDIIMEYLKKSTSVKTMQN